VNLKGRKKKIVSGKRPLMFGIAARVLLRLWSWFLRRITASETRNDINYVMIKSDAVPTAE